jgi:potassium efflux system protein
MRRIIKLIPLIILTIAILSSSDGFAQVKNKKKQALKRASERRAMHSRDSLLRSLNKSDTSINSLLQRIEQYTTTFNQIHNSLAEGLDTVDVSQQLPPVIKRIDKINSLANTHKSSTLRYLFVLRDNLDRIQSKLDDWQSDLQDVSTKLVQNQNDLLKFTKDSLLLKTVPADSLVRKTFFTQRKTIRLLWHKTDSTNRGNLLKVNLLQDKIAISYTKILDEGDQIDSKIKGFAIKAISGESNYLWDTDVQYNNFKSALSSTVKLNDLLFNYFIKNETVTHLLGFLFLVLIFTWITLNRIKVLRNNEDLESISVQANYIYKKPIVSSLLVAIAIIPYFYNQPPVVFLEIFFLASIVLSLILIKGEFPKIFNFLVLLFVLAIIYSVSNLFIEISNIDRYVILLLSILSIITGLLFFKKIKKEPEGHLPYTGIALKIFVALQILSLLLNLTGRFSLAKIIGVTAVLNLWFLVILYFVVQIIIQGLFLQFQTKKGGNSIINWIDYNLVEKKFRITLITAAALLWLYFLLQNLNIDDWASDYVSDILNQSRSIGGASFTFGGFVIFIFVIWLSSIASKIISYFYDVSAQRVTDLSILKKKNRTSALLIRMGVFSVGFLLAVAASGFPLDKLTIIISAFGVGIGFGLQNIVNNLVSGLILAFEKPINIGDVVEVDGHSGTMKEIGIRSSKIVTGDGSEVIIPNGDLISHQVINWTLSNSNRRIDLTIHTAYGVDIDKVKGLLKDLLSKRDDIMTNPVPSVFLNNVTESFVEFKVFYWADDINTTSELKSRVLADIYLAFNNEGIEMPSSQKDFYLHFPDGEQINLDKKTKDDKKDPKENLPDQVR